MLIYFQDKRISAFFRDATPKTKLILRHKVRIYVKFFLKTDVWVFLACEGAFADQSLMGIMMYV